MNARACLIGATVVVGWYFVGLWLWWAFGPITPAITIKESAVWSYETEPGGSVTRNLVFRANVTGVLHTYRRLAQTDCDKCIVYELEPAQREYVAGRVYSQARAVAIPEHVAPGRYLFEVEARWRANPLRDGVMAIPPFTVVVR